MSYTIQREMCSPHLVCVNNIQLSQEDVKYLGLHLDRRRTWCKYIFAKQKQVGITLTKMYWLFVRKLKLSTSNKLLIHKVKPLTIMYDILSLTNCTLLTADMILKTCT
jgi:hypothetical protein